MRASWAMARLYQRVHQRVVLWSPSQDGQAPPPVSRLGVAFVVQRLLDHGPSFLRRPGRQSADGHHRQQIVSRTAIAVVRRLSFHTADRSGEGRHHDLPSLARRIRFQGPQKKDPAGASIIPTQPGQVIAQSGLRLPSERDSRPPPWSRPQPPAYPGPCAGHTTAPPRLGKQERSRQSTELGGHRRHGQEQGRRTAEREGEGVVGALTHSKMGNVVSGRNGFTLPRERPRCHPARWHGSGW